METPAGNRLPACEPAKFEKCQLWMQVKGKFVEPYPPLPDGVYWETRTGRQAIQRKTSHAFIVT